MDDEQIRKMLTAEQVMEQVPISRTTLFRMERDELFPQGHLITAHLKLWFEDEIIAWQKALRDPSSSLMETVRRRKRKVKNVTITGPGTRPARDPDNLPGGGPGARSKVPAPSGDRWRRT